MSCTLAEKALTGSSGAEGPNEASSAASWNRIKLSKELANAVQDDARRKAIDSAKKRAVAQHVDYETFQAMVSVAHLKPIERDEWHRKPIESRSSPAWNFGASGSVASREQTEGISSIASCPKGERSDGSDAAPKTMDEFQRRWRSLGASADRLRYLRSIPPEKLMPLFRVEIRPGLLGEIFTALNDCWEPYSDGATTTGEVSGEERSLEKVSRDVGALSLESLEQERSNTDRNSEAEESQKPRNTGGWAHAESSETTEAGIGVRKEVEWTVQMLAVLSKSGRFALTLRLLSGAHKQAMQSFLKKVQVIIVQQSGVVCSKQFDIVRKAFEG